MRLKEPNGSEVLSIAPQRAHRHWLINLSSRRVQSNARLKDGTHEQLRLGLLLVPYGFEALAGRQECSLPAMRAPLRMPGVQDSRAS